jgi:hypothetical protein
VQSQIVEALLKLNLSVYYEGQLIPFAAARCPRTEHSPEAAGAFSTTRTQLEQNDKHPDRNTRWILQWDG